MPKIKDGWFLIWICLLGGTAIYAAPHEGYLTVDALYWKPMHCPIFVAERTNESLVIRTGADELYLTGDYNPGVRVRLGHQMCDWFSDISYLYFHSTEKASEERDGFDRLIIPVSPTSNEGFVNAVESSATFRYQNVDGRFGHCFCFNQDFTFFLYGNVRWVKIDFKNLVQGPSIVVPTFIISRKQDSHFNGGGFGLGLGGRFGLCYGFSLHGNAGIMAIIGETQLKNYSSTFGTTLALSRNLFLDRPERWNHILPAFTFALGLDYLLCWCDYTIQAEVAYELDYYSKVLRYPSSNNLQGNEVILINCQNIGFGGPRFNLTVWF